MWKVFARKSPHLIDRASVVFVLKRAGQFFQHKTHTIGILHQILLFKSLLVCADICADMFQVRVTEDRPHVTAAKTALSAVYFGENFVMKTENHLVETIFIQFSQIAHLLHYFFMFCFAALKNTVVLINIILQPTVVTIPVVNNRIINEFCGCVSNPIYPSCLVFVF